jgi:hypothetical protein
VPCAFNARRLIQPVTSFNGCRLETFLT